MYEGIKQTLDVLKEFTKLKKSWLILATSQVHQWTVFRVMFIKTELQIVWCVILTRLIKLRELKMPLIQSMIHDTNSFYNDYIVDKKYSRVEASQKLGVSVRGFNKIKNRAILSVTI